MTELRTTAEERTKYIKMIQVRGWVRNLCADVETLIAERDRWQRRYHDQMQLYWQETQMGGDTHIDQDYDDCRGCRALLGASEGEGG